MHTKRKIKEAAKVIFVLGAAVLSACILTFSMIYYYGPSGHYVAGQTILSPEIAEKMNYSESSLKTRDPGRLVFNGIEFSYFDTITREERRIPVDLATFHRFYEMIASEKSIEPLAEGIQQQFEVSPATLKLTVKSAGEKSIKTFQVIQFAGDYFRAQLLGQEDAGYYAYFHRSHIYQNILDLFTSKSQK